MDGHGTGEICHFTSQNNHKNSTTNFILHSFQLLFHLSHTFLRTNTLHCFSPPGCNNNEAVPWPGRVAPPTAADGETRKTQPGTLLERPGEMREKGRACQCRAVVFVGWLQWLFSRCCSAVHGTGYGCRPPKIFAACIIKCSVELDNSDTGSRCFSWRRPASFFSSEYPPVVLHGLIHAFQLRLTALLRSNRIWADRPRTVLALTGVKTTRCRTLPLHTPCFRPNFKTEC